ncbi:hypothetical protein LAZ67_13002328 [Cordylochernes scorpioides]|uniref:Thioredoxin domain-containing protein n=1 Tax=Cordylochernes scorpioides TaxID=51811 RepID=A0ABY6L4I3_9ARAC|nr:hypothetical protein LAZ67_13002328 [Cordylochernes scorpioides]
MRLNEEVLTGDLMEEEDLLDWFITQLEPNRIEEVTANALDRLVRQNEHVAVLFYKRQSEECAAALRRLEQIDDETDEEHIVFVKTEDPKAASKHRVQSLPQLVFFEHSIPYPYTGDLTQEGQVLDWILQQKSNEEIEEVTSSMLGELLDTYNNLVVLFYDSSSTRSKEVLQELENIDGKMAMPFVKLEDMTVAREYGVRDELPALIYFEEGVPSVYEGREFETTQAVVATGDCSNEEEVLEWLVKQHAEDSIEEITEEILEDLIIDREYVLVLFAPDDCGKECDDILLELENIDDDLDQYGTLLVTTSDVRLLRRQVSPSVSLPALVMFRHGEPMLYHGDLMNEDKILAWATSDEVLDQPGKIDEVQKKLLEKMLNLTDFLVVYFYSPRCSECERALRSLERVDDQLDNTDLNMVKVSDPKVINQYNIRVFPSLTFFKNKMPVFYDGLTFAWFPDQEKDDILRGLEAIYEDLEKYELKLVKTNVVSIAEELGFTEFPCLVYFENKMPSIYADGALPSEMFR